MTHVVTPNPYLPCEMETHVAPSSPIHLPQPQSNPTHPTHPRLAHDSDRKNARLGLLIRLTRLRYHT
jgi:hypothetical protein